MSKKNHSNKSSNGETNNVQFHDPRKNVIAQLEKQGINYDHVELPPDEVDYDDIKKSFTHTALSLIPYTRAYYESLAAEEELDNYSRIEAEKLKATQYYELTKLGESESVLKTMLQESNNDFFYFNKLRTKLEHEGRYFDFDDMENMEQLELNSKANKKKKSLLSKFHISLTSTKNKSTIPQNASSSATPPIQSQTPSIMKNRIRQARSMNFLMLNNRLLNNQHAIQVDISKLSNTTPCIWKGKAKNGTYLQCTNQRMFHPTRKIRDKDGNLVPAMMVFCPFHLPTCSSLFHKPDEQIFIKVPKIITYFCLY